MSEFETEARSSKRPKREPGESAGKDGGELVGKGKKSRRKRRNRRRSAPRAAVDNQASPALDQRIAGTRANSRIGDADPQENRPSTAHSTADENAAGQTGGEGKDSGYGRPSGKRARRRHRRRGNRNPDIVSANQPDGTPETKRRNGAARNRRRLRRNNGSDRNTGGQTKSADTASAGQPAISGAGGPQRNNGRPDRTTNRGAGQAGKPMPYAALDLGTNNCRLLMALPQAPGRFRVVDAFSRIVRLGEGLGSSGKLSDAAMERTMGALRACAAKLASRDVRRMRLIATEACRRAENGTEFLEHVRRETGLKLEVVDRETEARLAVAGCSALVDRKASGAVLFDIGGGSSELALLDLRKRRRHDLDPAIASWTSLPLGVVTLSEKHGGGRTVTRAVFEGMVEDVMERLQAYEGRNALVEAARHGEVHLLGTSGTVTTLAGIHLKLPRYDRRQVDGTWMDCENVSAIVDELVDMPYDQRVLNPCIGRERADLVLAGCAILAAILKLWPCPRLRVADRGLREGLLTKMMNEDDAWQRRVHQQRKGRR